MRAAILSWTERHVTKFLLKHSDIIPSSWRKAVAWFYPNAIVRKRFLEFFGVKMGSGTLANVCLIPIPGDGVNAIIGCNVSIAPNVTLVMQSDPNNSYELRKFHYISDKLSQKNDIQIGDDSWIGANVTILPGVTIGQCAVIGAGCVMVDDAEPYGIYAGVPGKKIGDVRQWEAKDGE